MLKWDIGEDEGTEIGFPVEESEEAGFRRYFIIMALLLPAIFALLFLARGWLVESEAVMREDLRGLIEQEERVRAFALRDEAAKFVAPDVSDEWKEHYLATLAEPDGASRLEVREVLLDGEAAWVTVQRDEKQQRRYYQLVEGNWRRAALPTESWGEVATVSTPNGIEISYRERDQAFAHALARDLDALEVLPSWSNQLSLRIEPAELQGALLVQSVPLSELGFMRRAKTEIVVNSPLIVQSRLDGEAAVRLALAKLLIQPIEPSHLSPSMLSMPRVQQAARTVAALRWALSSQEQKTLHTLWQSRAETSISSIFSATSSDNDIDPFDPTPEEATALLVTDYLHQFSAAKTVFPLVSLLAEEE